MVKGISKQVIVVRPPDTELFEQAIFILKEKALADGGVSDEELLRQARQAADAYLKAKVRGGHKSGHRFPGPALCALLGALCVGILWLLTVVLF